MSEARGPQGDPRPRIVIAPDSFKGSISAQDAAEAMSRGVRWAFAGEPVDIVTCPLADGGEGSLEALAAPMRLSLVAVETVDALGRPRMARIGVGPAEESPRVAVIEAAMANGLPHVSDLPLQPLGAHSYGVGLLLRAALDHGAQEVVLCVGGSASNDGGTGMLRALGARFLDAEGAPVARGAAGLGQIARVDVSGVDPRLAGTRVRVAVDVENPLLGPRGTAAVFSPQKGAGPAEVLQIEAGLAHLTELTGRPTGSGTSVQRRGLDLATRPGAGAAGGLPVAALAWLDAAMEPGAELIADAVGLGDLIAGADLALTGEGSFDSQSLDGKAISAVLARARGRCPVVVLAGRIAVDHDIARRAGVGALWSIASGPATLAEMTATAPELIERAAAQVASLLRLTVD